MATPVIIDGPVGNTDQFLAGIQAQIAILQAGPQNLTVTAQIATLQALAAGLQ